MTMTSASPSLGADGVQFTPEVIKEIKDLVAQGISRDEIASRLGVSVGRGYAAERSRPWQ